MKRLAFCVCVGVAGGVVGFFWRDAILKKKNMYFLNTPITLKGKSDSSLLSLGHFLIERKSGRSPPIAISIANSIPKFICLNLCNLGAHMVWIHSSS